MLDRVTHSTGLNGRSFARRHKPRTRGAIGQIDHYTDEAQDSLFGGGMLARMRAKRDAKAAKKVRKAGAMTAKERRASKLKSKNKLRSAKGQSKIIKADAKTIKANKGGGAGKFADTLQKGVEIAGGLLNKNKEGEEVETETSADVATEKEAKAGFNPLAWYMILLYIAVVGAIIYFAFIK